MMEAKVADAKRFDIVTLVWWLTVFAIAVLVVAAVVLSVLKFLHLSHSSPQLPTEPTNIVQNYATALDLALQFFDIQKCNVLESFIIALCVCVCVYIYMYIYYLVDSNSWKLGFLAAGKLQNNRISWRGDSGLRDGSEANLDLSKGMYDAGDLMKFGFPMAFTATVLSWAILEYGDHLDAVNQLEYAQDSVSWITDYLINAHPASDVLYVQVNHLFELWVFNFSSSIIRT